MDSLRAILFKKEKLREKLKQSKTSDKERILILCDRSNNDLINDFINSWFLKHTGLCPVKHATIKVPDCLLPTTNNPEEFWKYINEIKKEIS